MSGIQLEPLTESQQEYYAPIPEHLRTRLDAHATERAVTGHFLSAVLENALQGAVGYADNESLACLRLICKYVYNVLPGSCWGSKLEVYAWRNPAQDKEGHCNDCRYHGSGDAFKLVALKLRGIRRLPVYTCPDCQATDVRMADCRVHRRTEE